MGEYPCFETSNSNRIAHGQTPGWVGYIAAKPGYVTATYQEVAAYADFDSRPHLGLGAEFHQLNHSAGYPSYQRTYEIGGRFQVVASAKKDARTSLPHISIRRCGA